MIKTGAQNRNRTCTSLRTTDFESVASTNSAIWALRKIENRFQKFQVAILRIPLILSKINTAYIFKKNRIMQSAGNRDQILITFPLPPILLILLAGSPL